MYITMAFYEKFWNKLVKNLALTEWGEVRLDLEILKGNRGNRELYVDYSDPLLEKEGVKVWGLEYFSTQREAKKFGEAFYKGFNLWFNILAKHDEMKAEPGTFKEIPM